MKDRWIALALSAASMGCDVAVVNRADPAADAPRAVVAVPRETGAVDEPVPVLVELFTSEGCSSCPPADLVLATLQRTQPVAGARVVPLGLHVDYWDDLGWVDPFSSPRATERQRGYVSLGGGTYTPQAIVDGQEQLIGSHQTALERAIAEAASRPHATIGIDIAAPAKDDTRVVVTMRIGTLPAETGADAEGVLALTQNAVQVSVARGENGGSTLEHIAVVRDLEIVGAAPAEGGSLEGTLDVPADVSVEDLRVVAFVQARGDRRVLGTATRGLGALER